METDIKKEQAFQQILNDLCAHFYTEGNLNMEKIEGFILKNLLEKFTQSETARMTGICTRTIRNKKNPLRLL